MATEFKKYEKCKSCKELKDKKCKGYDFSIEVISMYCKKYTQIKEK